MTLDKDHLFEGITTLKVTKNRLECRSQVLGLDRVEELTHRRITRHPPDAVNALQVALGAFLVKGEQRRRFEGEQGKGGHQGIMQRDFGVAFSVIRKLTKDVVNRAQQGIGTEMFSHFGNHHAHNNPQQQIGLFMSGESHFDMAVYEKTRGNAL